MTTDDKYFRRKMPNVTQQFEAPLSQKQETFSRFFIAFLKDALNLEHLEKRWLLKRLKGLASEHLSVINVLTGSKHC